MFQYTHLIRKYSLRSSNRARLNGKNVFYYHCWLWWCFLMMFFNLAVINNNKGMTRPKAATWNNHIFLLYSPDEETAGKTINE